MQKEKPSLGQLRKHKMFFGLSPIGLLTLVACGGDSKSGGDNAVISKSISGSVVKGPLSNALVFLDYDSDSVQDTGEPSVRTGSSGDFSLTTSNSDYTIVAITDRSTVDTSSGTVLSGVTLKAVKGAEVVTPVTTLMKEGGFTADQVVKVLQLPNEIDPLNFNPYTHYHNVSALAVEKVAQQIMTVVNAYAAAAEGAGATEAKAFEAAIKSVSEIVKVKISKLDDLTAFTRDQTLDFTSTVDLALIKAQVTTEVADLSGINTKAFNALAEDISTSIKNVNDAIEAVTDLTSDATKSVFSTSQVLVGQVLAAAASEVSSPGAGYIAFTSSAAVTTSAANKVPTDITLIDASISDALMVVGTLKSTDSDQRLGVDHTYEIAQISGTDYSAFSLNKASGELSLVTQNGYKSSYSLTILSTDEGGKTFSKSITIVPENYTIAGYNERTLTSGTDTFTTTTGDDKFVAVNSGDLATGDTLDGGAGTDALQAVYTSSSSDTLIRPILTGIETVSLSVSDGHATPTTTTLDLNQSSGFTSVSFGNKAFNTSAETIVVSGVSTTTAITVVDAAGSATTRANNYTVTYDGVSGTSDEATVNIEMSKSDGELGIVSMAGIERATVSASGGFDASYTLSAPNATRVTIKAVADSEFYGYKLRDSYFYSSIGNNSEYRSSKWYHNQR